MTLPKKLTYKNPQWKATLVKVEPLPEIREAWGDVVGDIAELMADAAAEVRNLPNAESIRHSLRSIRDNPTSVDRDDVGWCIDTEIEPMLGPLAIKVFGAELESLTAEQLSECAGLALADLEAAPARRGRRNKRAVVDGVRALLEATSDTLSRQDQRQMLEDVLGRTFGAVDVRRLDDLLAEARRLMRDAP